MAENITPQEMADGMVKLLHPERELRKENQQLKERIEELEEKLKDYAIDKIMDGDDDEENEFPELPPEDEEQIYDAIIEQVKRTKLKREGPMWEGKEAVSDIFYELKEIGEKEQRVMDILEGYNTEIKQYQAENNELKEMVQNNEQERIAMAEELVRELKKRYEWREEYVLGIFVTEGELFIEANNFQICGMGLSNKQVFERYIKDVPVKESE